MADSRNDRSRIPKEQLTAYERWELPLLDARGNEVPREEERDIKPLTAAELQDIHQQAEAEGHGAGLEKGHREGFAKGREEGFAQGVKAGTVEGREKGERAGREHSQQQMQALEKRIDLVMESLVLPIRQQQNDLEEALVQLATAVAKAVVQRELSQDSSHIMQVVRQAMAALPSTTETVRISANPKDIEPLQASLARLDASTKLVEDAAISPGGCRVETRYSLVDFTVEKRFQQVVCALVNDASKNESQEPGDDSSPL
ncbi:flagellar assembly protein FliH [Marinobacter psychrophilus]|jgi:flagellar assembly protein FliH|uniref:flagellar assembly protein FliH n=1 Tax=Marinobacter psychrophilus TaxID=330734 RepID=UPI001B735879|nr:flagellar assembly protein FliH [Marinobacter psychrophilus]MBQ0762686.1 flagellar assembly protein FliH [Marinobacter psychrophilus]MBQ0844517.1 flagellar assembly protein FliH [Marinobacter psychrophilus]